MQLNLGAKIRELRHRDGRTQEMLADALGVTSQAVSRWESGGSYPDMELMPSIANYFGVTIDELFGYNNERSKKIDEIICKINTMNAQNNGVDINIDECLALAREAMIEFPANEKVMLCLASVLYNAGYVRYGEYHYPNAEGYDCYDTELHRTYNEWQEAINIYEKLLVILDDGEMRDKAVLDLMQLYLNIGETGKAMTVVKNAPRMDCSREFLKLKACDGRSRLNALSETILILLDKCVDLMTASITANYSLTSEDAIMILKNAIGLFDLVCNDEEYGLYGYTITRVYLYMSEFQWRAGERDKAFESLYKALDIAKAYESYNGNNEITYSSPLLNTVKINPNGYDGFEVAKHLAGDWPWWAVPNYDDVKAEMQSDPRWSEWVKKTQE